MTTLGELKVGEKFRDREESFPGELFEVVAPAKQHPAGGYSEVGVWSDKVGYTSLMSSTDVIPIREPQYKPYSDLRVLREYLLNKITGHECFVTELHERSCTIGASMRMHDSKAIFAEYTHLDGTPCGELVE